MTLMSFFEECLNIHYATSSEKCKGLILSVLNIELAKFFLHLYLNLFLNLSPFHGNGNYIPCMFRKVFLVVWGFITVFWMTFLLMVPGWQQIGTSDHRASYDNLGTLW